MQSAQNAKAGVCALSLLPAMLAASVHQIAPASSAKWVSHPEIAETNFLDSFLTLCLAPPSNNNINGRIVMLPFYRTSQISYCVLQGSVRKRRNLRTNTRHHHLRLFRKLCWQELLSRYVIASAPALDSILPVHLIVP